METTLSAPVSFTANAIAEIKRLMNEEGFDTVSYTHLTLPTILRV